MYVGSAKREPFVIMHDVVVPLLGPELNVFSPSKVVAVSTLKDRIAPHFGIYMEKSLGKLINSSGRFYLVNAT